VNSDAGISVDVTFSQTPGVPIAGGRVCVLPPQPTTSASAAEPKTWSLFMGLVRSKKDATLNIPHRR
jgi:hypothetical protein